MVCRGYAGRNDARHDWATPWLISPCVRRPPLWTCRAPSFCLSNQRTLELWRSSAGPLLCGRDPCFRRSWATRTRSMWFFIKLILVLLIRSQRVSCFGPGKLDPLACALGFRTLIPKVFILGRCHAIPRHGPCRPLRRQASAGTEKWPSAFREWVARCIFSDFSATAGVGDLKAAPSSETEATDEEVGEDRIFRFDPVVPTGTTDGLGDIEMRALNHLRRGYIAEEDLVLLSQQLPDETRIRESTARVAGQRSFTTGAYIHREEIGLRRNLRDFKWTSELLARLLASSFPGKPFTSLALFRDLKQPPHRDSTNGPEENLLLACTSFRSLSGRGDYYCACSGCFNSVFLSYSCC